MSRLPSSPPLLEIHKPRINCTTERTRCEVFTLIITRNVKNYASLVLESDYTYSAGYCFPNITLCLRYSTSRRRHARRAREISRRRHARGRIRRAPVPPCARALVVQLPFERITDEAEKQQYGCKHRNWYQEIREHDLQRH